MNGLSRLAVRAVDIVNRRGKAVGVRLLRLTGKRGYAIHPPVVLDTPWAGTIDAVGGLSLGLDGPLSRWKRTAALRHPESRTGFRVVARKRR